MRLVMRELTHRSKNLLAVVQAMARKTASLAPDVDTFIRDFSSRLRAIAASHDLLVAESWSGAEIRDLLVASLSQTVDPAGPGIRIEGQPLTLSPDAAQTLGLAFHELTMNAVRHGALSVAGGHGLGALGAARTAMVRLEWREADGPAVAVPVRSGFGRLLLERLVGASLGGEVSLDFRPEGLVCIAHLSGGSAGRGLTPHFGDATRREIVRQGASASVRFRPAPGIAHGCRRSLLNAGASNRPLTEYDADGPSGCPHAPARGRRADLDRRGGHARGRSGPGPCWSRTPSPTPRPSSAARRSTRPCSTSASATAAATHSRST